MVEIKDVNTIRQFFEKGYCIEDNFRKYEGFNPYDPKCISKFLQWRTDIYPDKSEFDNSLVIKNELITEMENKARSGVSWDVSPIWFLLLGIENILDNKFRLGHIQSGYVFKCVIDFLYEATLQEYLLYYKDSAMQNFFYEFFYDYCANEGTYFQLRVMEMNFAEINELISVNNTGNDLYSIIDRYWTDMLYDVMIYIVQYWFNDDNINDFNDKSSDHHDYLGQIRDNY